MANRLLANRYELTEKIGEGGMAAVYKARDTKLKRFVAIKILRPEFLDDESFVENFVKESQAAAGLVHPNIVGVYDVGNEGNIHYIAMELVNGTPLSDFIVKKGKIEYKEAISILRQVASALSFAHRNGIIHRDVKPHNILITDTGVAKLADFGIAKAMTEAQDTDSKIMGSVHYFSPEQARGLYVDAKSDIYSLGIVFYEMLTGKVPFDGDNPVSIALMHINNPMPKVSDSVPGLPPKIDRIIQKMTEKFQSNRYENAEEIINNLDTIEFMERAIGDNVLKQGQSVAAEDKVEEEPMKKEASKKERKKVDNAPKKNVGLNVILIFLITVAVAAAVLVFGLIFDWFGGQDEISMPDFRGKTYQEALEYAKEFDFVVVRGDDVYSPDYEAGIVTDQSPAVGSKVVKGRQITINVSKGIKNNVVPIITGKTLDDAKKVLENYGFKIGAAKIVRNNAAEGTVLTQSVKGGETLPKGGTIDVTVSDGQGNPLVEMPEIIGLTPEQANVVLTANKLVLGNVTYEEVLEGIPGTIFFASVNYLEEVEEGTSIDIIVVKETEVDQDPDEDPEPPLG